MARPRKPAEEHRTKWDVLYPTADERISIEAAAKAAGLTVSRYLIEAHAGTTLRPVRADAAVVQALVAAELHLAAIAREIANNTSPIEAVVLQAHLMAVERDFRRAALPWHVSVAPQAGEAPS